MIILTKNSIYNIMVKRHKTRKQIKSKKQIRSKKHKTRTVKGGENIVQGNAPKVNVSTNAPKMTTSANAPQVTAPTTTQVNAPVNVPQVNVTIKNVKNVPKQDIIELFDTIYSKNQEVAIDLIKKKGINPNVTDKYGESVLYAAVSNNLASLVLLLIKKGAIVPEPKQIRERLRELNGETYGERSNPFDYLYKYVFGSKGDYTYPMKKSGPKFIPIRGREAIAQALNVY